MSVRACMGCLFAGAIALLGLGSACQHSTIAGDPPASGGRGAGGSEHASGGGAGSGGAGAGGATKVDASLAGTAGGLNRLDGSAGMPWFSGGNGGRSGGPDAMGWPAGGAGAAGTGAGGAGGSAGRSGFFGFDAHPPFGFGDASSATGGATVIDADVDGPKWSSCSSFPRCGPNEVPVRMQNPAMGVQMCACVANPCGTSIPACSCAGSICGPSATCAYMPDSGFLVCTEHG